MTYLMFLAGLAGLFLGGEALVNGAAGVARAFRVPAFLIGLLLVGFGTSMPELMVSLDAALAGVPAIAIGNVVGSNIANILLILGTAAAMGAIAAPWRFLWRNLVWMGAAAVVLMPLFWSGTIGRAGGIALLVALGVYIWQAIATSPATPPDDDAPQQRAGRAALIALAGLVLVLLGAKWLVDSASEIARSFGVSEAVIGLTIVAIGTSLPELASTLAAALKGQRDLALGNIVGSNIFNTFAILGATATVAPLPVDPRFLTFDVPVLLVATVGLLALSLFLGRVPRVAGFVSLAGYAAYLLIST